MQKSPFMKKVYRRPVERKILIDQEDNCAAILELNKLLGSANVIFFAELARVERIPFSQQARP